MQCHLNGVQISDVPKFISKNPIETSHTIEVGNPFDTAHPFIILLQLSGVTSYFDVYSPNAAEYEINDVPNIYLTAEETPWHSSKYLKQFEPYTPWSNDAKREIKELEKAAGHKLLRSGAPKHLCDDCLE